MKYSLHVRSHAEPRASTSALVRTTILVTALMSMAGFGCQAPQGGDKVAAKASATSCADYAARICKEAGGDTSPTCTSFKSATDMLPPEACAAGLANVDFTVKKLGDMRKKCDELTSKLCKDIGEQTPTCEMVKTQTKNFPPERCDMMMQHYAEVLADLKKQEDKNKPLSEDKVAKIAAADAPAFGPADSKVTIVEFSDFQCPFCSRAADVAHKVKEKYGDKVRFVFRQFPLSFHENAQGAAEAALAANAQGKFWEFHDKLFANQQKLDRPSLEGYAKEVGLDVAAFKKALDEKKFAPNVTADTKLGEEVSVDGTPTMFLNGARVANPTDFDGISKQIETALSSGG